MISSGNTVVSKVRSSLKSRDKEQKGKKNADLKQDDKLDGATMMNRLKQSI